MCTHHHAACSLLPVPSGPFPLSPLSTSHRLLRSCRPCIKTPSAAAPPPTSLACCLLPCQRRRSAYSTPRSAGQPSAMGNCLNAASKQRRGGLLPEEEESLSEMRRISQLLREDGEEEYYSEETTPPPEAAAAAGLKVKVVLTRAELEWLMAQLKTGDQRLEDLLHHMHAAADKPQLQGGGGGWRPRLESILECPETLAVS